MKKKQFLSGIDIGTTKISCLLGISENGDYRILGSASRPSKGLKKGVIVNLSETIEGIRSVVAETEKQAQLDVESAFVTLGGTYTTGINRSGKADIKGRASEISADDIARAISQARDCKIPQEYQLVHSLTQNYQVDGRSGIEDPLGMGGRQLIVRLHLVVNAAAIVQNVVNAVNKAGVLVDGVVMQQLASAEATLSQDEKELGAIVVDIGGGTSDVVVYSEGGVCHSAVLPVGSNLITKDIAIGLKVPLQEAESLKVRLGCVFPESVPEEELIEVTEVGTGRRRTVTRRVLCQIVNARSNDLILAIADNLKQIGLTKELITGVILTGGGAVLDGLIERAEQALEMPVRLGYPQNVVDNHHPLFHPAYTAAFGLLVYGSSIHSESDERMKGVVVTPKPRLSGGRLRNWILEAIG